MVPKKHNIFIPINRQEANLPIIYNSYVTSAQKKFHEPLLISGMVFICLGYLDPFGGLITDTDGSVTEVELMLTDEFDHFLSFVKPALDLVKIIMLLIPKRNFYYGTGSLVLACTAYNN